MKSILNEKIDKNKIIELEKFCQKFKSIIEFRKENHNLKISNGFILAKYELFLISEKKDYIRKIGIGDNLQESVDCAIKLLSELEEDILKDIDSKTQRETGGIANA